MFVHDRLRAEAVRFRELAEKADQRTAEYLRGLADDYEAEADDLDFNAPAPCMSGNRASPPL